MSDSPPPPEPPPLTPPGTSPTKFWESSGAKVAVAMTMSVFNTLWRPFVVAWGDRVLGAGTGVGLALGIEAAEWAWLAAVGIQRTDTSSLRWK